MREVSLRRFFVIHVLVWIILPAGRVALCAQTWRLDEQGQWKAVAGSSEDEFLLRLSEIKKLVDRGKPGEVKKAAKKLKADFPEIAGGDFNDFIAAEVFLAKGKLTKAVRGYDKMLDDFPRSPLRDAAMERQFGIASDFLAGRKRTLLPGLSVHCYDEGIKIMEKISDRAGSVEIARKALYAAAANYESRKKFNEAYLKWSQISTRWPAGQPAKDALLGMARNKYATFRGPQFDASGLISARTYYENFRLRYPQEAQNLKVDEILKRIDEQLAEKNLLIAQYYSRTGSELPANMYNQMIVDNWPNTKAAESAREGIGKTD